MEAGPAAKPVRELEMDEVMGQTSDQANVAELQVVDTTASTFRQDVLVESARQPVLVDFWAPWCQPCKQLDPVLRKVVASAAGRVKLVKMNIEEHPQIAGQLGIKSIPAVVAFQKGQPVDGFAGALPESQVKGFVERIIGPISGRADELLELAEAALQHGDSEAALEGFGEVLGLEDGNPKALAGQVRALLQAGRLDDASKVLPPAQEGAKEAPEISSARALLAIALQAAEVGDFGALEEKVDSNPADHQSRFDLAVAYNAAGEREKAADALLEIIKRDRKWNDDGARKQLLQFFEAWGPIDPDTISARRKLSGLLFS